jgi:hypothetical protein
MTFIFNIYLLNIVMLHSLQLCIGAARGKLDALAAFKPKDREREELHESFDPECRQL